MFGYTCTECGKGTVRATPRRRIDVVFEHIPFVVPEGVVGVCDHCRAEYRAAREYKRWRRLFEASRREQGVTLSPDDARALRERLGLSVTDFAVLIGTTRQSIHHWEREERESEPNRMADLMMRLVREAVTHGKDFDVLEFLVKRAEAEGRKIDLDRLRELVTTA